MWESQLTAFADRGWRAIAPHLPGFGGAADTRQPATNIDPSHAFYLGYEMAKAAIALTLSKEYRQDEALNWGYLTQPEESHRLRKSGAARKSADGEQSRPEAGP